MHKPKQMNSKLSDHPGVLLDQLSDRYAVYAVRKKSMERYTITLKSCNSAGNGSINKIKKTEPTKSMIVHEPHVKV